MMKTGTTSPGLVSQTTKDRNLSERESNKQIRRKATMLIIKAQSALNLKLNDMDIPDDMRQLVKGLNISDETLKAMRIVVAQQIGGAVQQEQRD